MSVAAENSQKKQQKKAEEHPQPFLYTMRNVNALQNTHVYQI